MLQHNWATAVETMGTLLGQALKSRQGDKEWLDFFAVTSSAFAHIEGATPVPGYEALSKEETFSSVGKAEKTLGVLDKLQGLAIAAEAIHSSKESSRSYHLLILDSIDKTVEIHSFGRGELEEASIAYSLAEQKAADDKKTEPVLVSA